MKIPLNLILLVTTDFLCCKSESLKSSVEESAAKNKTQITCQFKCGYRKGRLFACKETATLSSNERKNETHHGKCTKQVTLKS